MIGIYRIVNKLSGKSYIGQSIHCGKRFDEHTKGKQLIDQIIQVEGVENFTFELLKECDTNELSYWEDYYIIKYNTMYPNGYNKRWNCSEEIRKEIRGEIESERLNEIKTENFDNTTKEGFIKIPAARCEDFDFVKLTSKQWGIYYWLIIKSYQDNNNNQYFIYKNSFTYSGVGRELNITDKTIKRALEVLEEKGLIIITTQVIYIPYPKTYTFISYDLLEYLIEICKNTKTSNKLISLYGILKRLKKLRTHENVVFCLKTLANFLGKSKPNIKDNKKLKQIVSLLIEKNLIEVIQNNKIKGAWEYIEYELIDIKEELDSDLCFDFNGESIDFYANKKEELKMKNQEINNEQSIHYEEHLNEQNKDFETHLISEEDLKLLKERLAYQWDLLKDKFTAND